MLAFRRSRRSRRSCHILLPAVSTMRRKPEQPSRSPLTRSRKLGFALAIGLVTIVVLEGGARWLLSPPPPNAYPGLSANEMEDDALLWRNRPGAEGPINALGFRGNEIGLEKAPGVRRILSLGESTTYGDGVDWTATYSQRLDDLLRERGVAAQVINGGVRAWSTVQSVKFVDLEASRLQPDVVLFYHELNDFLPTTFRGLRLQGAALSDRELMNRSWVVGLGRHSRLVSTVRLWLARRQATATLKDLAAQAGADVLNIRALPYDGLPDTVPGGRRPWISNDNPLVRVPDADREAALRQLVSLTRARGIQLILIHPAYRLSKPHRCLLTRLATEERVPLLDVEDLLAVDATSRGLAKADYFRDSAHPNEMGHDVIARGLAAMLAK